MITYYDHTVLGEYIMKLMVFKVSASVCLSILCSVTSLPSLAETPITVRVGFFNLGMVKANYAQAASAESIRAQAEAQLRKEVEESNQRIQKMVAEKKPSGEVQKAVHEAQIIIDAKQQSLAQLVETSSGEVRTRILQAVNLVARDKSIDIIVDGQGVYAGGQKFIDNGVDITADIIKKLQSGEIISGASPPSTTTQDNKRTAKTTAGK